MTKSNDERVLELYEQLLEIEQRLIPTGLHVFGRPSPPRERGDLLKMIASFDRPEAGLRALPEELADDAIREFIARGTEAAVTSLEKRGLNAETTQPLFALLEQVSTKLQTNTEIDSLVRALRGEFIEPGPGADIVQNPDILPTGRNTHAINPYGVPSAVAFARGKIVANSLLDRYKEENKRYPEAMALVLWGLDNIKTQGEGVAQALWLLGVRPVRDALNRATDVDVIPLAELKRPRIDVVMTASGIFRDLFAPTMLLLDKAVRRVAALDEPLDENYVRQNINDSLQRGKLHFDDAVTRVFSNAPGNYGTNVNFMVLDSQWETPETLGDLFMVRKSFAYTRDSRGRNVEGREARTLMDDALSRVEATYQNLDSFEVGITDVDHYFEYLGGISRAVESLTSARPAIYVSDSLSPQTKVRSLEETVRLETRTKMLNPKWYEGMLQHGFRGVAEIENHVANTFGWSATADAVDPWIYTEISKTYLLDPAMFERLMELNPYSTASLTKRLLEAHERGYWNPDEDVIEKLRELLNSSTKAPQKIG